ncbi:MULTISPECIES: methyltransferase [unclassified Luteococcus]|uniref:methyltransferase n=1 Tax=unclassified Luteococcus TaxID=2639923 RepID=UPI00313DAB07
MLRRAPPGVSIGSMLTPTQAAQLRTALLAADYTIDAVINRIGETGQEGLGRNSTIPALDVLGDATDPQAALIKLWPLQQEVPLAAVRAALGASTGVAPEAITGQGASTGSAAVTGQSVFDALVEAGILRLDGQVVRALVDIRPFGADEDLPQAAATQGPLAGWVVSDLTPGLDQVTTRTRPDYVLGVSPASTSLAQMTMRTTIGSALDLGTGCGVQSLHLARHAERVVATDINPRALELAGLTAQLNQLDVDLRDGSLYEPVAGERFDLIVTNPPYVMSPPTTDGERLVYREGSFAGDGLVEAVVKGAPAHLNPGGSLQVLCNWAILDGQPWEERVAGWAEGSGCDLWVVERERLDIYHYIEVWLTDAGLAGSPEWQPRYREWIEYFKGLGIVGVGMGWITLTRSERPTPDIQVESWPHAIAQPVGPALAEHQACVTHALLSDGQILAQRWKLAEHVTQETLGQPGAADPQHIVLRSAAGLRRAMEVDTALGGVLGACDGELTLGQITAAIAMILEVDEAALVGSVMPGIREALRDGLLVRADAGR